MLYSDGEGAFQHWHDAAKVFAISPVPTALRRIIHFYSAYCVLHHERGDQCGALAD